MGDFTLSDLARILRQGAGTAEGVELDESIADKSFEAIGYDSLALLETASRVEREFGVALTDDAVVTNQTPAEFVALVNKQLVR